MRRRKKEATLRREPNWSSLRRLVSQPRARRRKFEIDAEGRERRLLLCTSLFQTLRGRVNADSSLALNSCWSWKPSEDLRRRTPSPKWTLGQEGPSEAGHATPAPAEGGEGGPSSHARPKPAAEGGGPGQALPAPPAARPWARAPGCGHTGRKRHSSQPAESYPNCEGNTLRLQGNTGGGRSAGPALTSFPGRGLAALRDGAPTWSRETPG